MATVDNRDPSDDIAMVSAHAHTSNKEYSSPQVLDTQVIGRPPLSELQVNLHQQGEMADRSLELVIRNISKANPERLDPKLQSKEAGSDMESWSSDGYLEEPFGSLNNAQPPEGSIESMDLQCEKGGDISDRSL